jgi:hypothetical protein
MRVDDGSDYLALIRRRPRPSVDQMRAFARFLASDHSWYKKLPLRGAGEPFFLYLDPQVHVARVRTATGEIVARDVTRELGDRNCYEFRIGLRPGDVDPGATGPLHYIFSGTGTSEYRELYGYWSYWNFGPPAQPPAEALADASLGIQVLNDQMDPIAVPPDLLERGLVYLRATISGNLGPTAEEYTRLRRTEGLPDPFEDQARQLEELMTAMRRVTARVYA